MWQWHSMDLRIGGKDESCTLVPPLAWQAGPSSVRKP